MLVRYIQKHWAEAGFALGFYMIVIVYDLFF